jgi:hypothetical protein
MHMHTRDDDFRTEENDRKNSSVLKISLVSTILIHIEYNVFFQKISPLVIM